MLRLLAFLLLLPSAALAAPTFLPAGRIGLELPPGFQVASSFPGFENPSTGATFLLVERPREAWARLRGTFTDTGLKQQGVEITKRETVQVGGSEGLLLRGVQSVGPVKLQKWILIVGDITMTPIVTFQVPSEKAAQYKPEAIRAALLSLQVRAPLTLEEQVATLPFTIGAIDGFHIDRTMDNNAVILTPDPNLDTQQPPPIFVAIAMKDSLPEGPAADDVAKRGLENLNTVDALEIETVRSVDLAGQQGHEIIAKGTDRRSGSTVVVVQWLRPRPGGMLRYIGMGPDANRAALLADFQRLRDAVAAKP